MCHIGIRVRDWQYHDQLEDATTFNRLRILICTFHSKSNPKMPPRYTHCTHSMSASFPLLVALRPLESFMAILLLLASPSHLFDFLSFVAALPLLAPFRHLFHLLSFVVTLPLLAAPHHLFVLLIFVASKVIACGLGM